MPSALKSPGDALVRRGRTVLVRPPTRRDERAFLAAVAKSARLHRQWVQPPTTPAAFRLYVRRYATQPLRDIGRARQIGWVVCERATEELVGVYNFSEIIRGSLQSAFLGYYAFAGMNARGLMRDGLQLALDQAFRVLRLHRVEVNVQPGNARSRSLVEAAGFTREGYSRGYVKIAGRWRDHVRYAILAEDWRRTRR